MFIVIIVMFSKASLPDCAINSFRLYYACFCQRLSTNIELDVSSLTTVATLQAVPTSKELRDEPDKKRAATKVPYLMAYMNNYHIVRIAISGHVDC